MCDNLGQRSNQAGVQRGDGTVGGCGKKRGCGGDMGRKDSSRVSTQRKQEIRTKAG